MPYAFMIALLLFSFKNKKLDNWTILGKYKLKIDCSSKVMTSDLIQHIHMEVLEWASVV